VVHALIESAHYVAMLTGDAPLTALHVAKAGHLLRQAAGAAARQRRHRGSARSTLGTRRRRL